MRKIVYFSLNLVTIVTDTIICAVLFDFGGMLAEEGFHNGFVKLATEQGVDVQTMPKRV
ncbi:hypothetical protein [Candidatus Endoriftia persephone]|jgi:hypothetical protein|uniref:Uncharacterized protein n=1 Tax=Candidatus Endoriftia persephonae TaxID=393765 RepID=A0A9J7A1Z5_9GAMM|nr:hypothetical protein [Candidatus Endoriftia persephone]USF89085.1 hypothetical protein L0Y14_07600 [Candidatus Endoriftia persephone]